MARMVDLHFGRNYRWRGLIVGQGESPAPGTDDVVVVVARRRDDLATAHGQTFPINATDIVRFSMFPTKTFKRDTSMSQRRRFSSVGSGRDTFRHTRQNIGILTVLSTQDRLMVMMVERSIVSRRCAAHHRGIVIILGHRIGRFKGRFKQGGCGIGRIRTGPTEFDAIHHALFVFGDEHV